MTDSANSSSPGQSPPATRDPEAERPQGARTPTVSSAKMIGTLGGVCMAAGFLIVLAVQATQARIADNKRAAVEKAVFDVLPNAVKRASYAYEDDAPRLLTDDAEAVAVTLYAGYDESGQLVGVALPAAKQGYADVIRILYGYDPRSGQIVGMTVLESKETPGLGDKIEKDPAFLANFESLDTALDETGNALRNPIQFVKNGEKTDPWQIDGIVGATISSKAIAEMLDQSAGELVPYVVRHQDLLKEVEQ